MRDRTVVFLGTVIPVLVIGLRASGVIRGFRETPARARVSPTDFISQACHVNQPEAASSTEKCTSAILRDILIASIRSGNYTILPYNKERFVSPFWQARILVLSYG